MAPSDQSPGSTRASPCQPPPSKPVRPPRGSSAPRQLRRGFCGGPPRSRGRTSASQGIRGKGRNQARGTLVDAASASTVKKSPARYLRRMGLRHRKERPGYRCRRLQCRPGRTQRRQRAGKALDGVSSDSRKQDLSLSTQTRCSRRLAGAYPLVLTRTPIVLCSAGCDVRGSAAPSRKRSPRSSTKVRPRRPRLRSAARRVQNHPQTTIDALDAGASRVSSTRAHGRLPTSPGNDIGKMTLTRAVWTSAIENR